MLFEITHRTSYRYEAPVFLLPHLLRLKPATDASQRLLSFDLTIDPAPTGRSANIDLDGTDTTLVWFDPLTEYLTVEAKSTVETLRTNPFDFLWVGEHSLPVRYAADLAPVLLPYTGKEVPVRVRELAQSVADESGRDARTFPLALTNRIHATCVQIRRDEGEPWPPEETLARQEGSCRDLSVLFMAACRSLGYAARFVSGYLAVEGENGFDLHAWPEVYLPGGGWRAYDPSTGLAVAEAHIACARAANPRHAAPISGTYRGRAASTLETELTINRLDEPAG
ncbi:MAG TPA: transglutaminase family protein [Dehalococcoidia bacterium]|nr:transglutaminase family protein [Dehalococcoidia bacterium]